MGTNLMKVRKGLSLDNHSTPPVNPVNGDIYYDSTQKSFVQYNNGYWINVASRADVTMATDITSTQVTSTKIQSSLIRVVGSTPSALHGMSPTSDGREVTVYNNSISDTLTVKHSSVVEPVSTNKIVTATQADVQLLPGQSAVFAYDSSQFKWVMLSSSGGSAFDSNSILVSSRSINTIVLQTTCTNMQPSSNSFPFASTTGLFPGLSVIGYGMQDNTVVVSVVGLTVTISTTTPFNLTPGSGSAYTYTFAILNKGQVLTNSNGNVLLA